MSRLLFAAARGARIQSRWVDGTQWQTTSQFMFVDGMRYYRIHPDDAHLAYGPISTALREIALTGDCVLVDLPYIEVALLKEEGHYHSTKEQFGVFLLILAEFLADSGL